MSCITRFRRHLSRLSGHKLLVLTISFGVTLFMLDMKGVLQNGAQVSRSDVMKMLVGSIRHPVSFQINDDNNNNRNTISNYSVFKSCPMIDFFAAVDGTAKGHNPDIVCKNVNADTDIVCRIYLQQIGLDHLVDRTCKLDNPNRVPRVVYFVIFGTYTFKFWHYVAMVAAKKFIKPTAVYVIGDQHPNGRWWQRVLRDVHGVRFVYRELPTNITGNTVRFRHHLSDVVRLQTLYMNGGIYLDADMVVVRDLEPLLDYDITLGMVENGTGMGNAFIAAKRHSPFIKEWYSQYKEYRNKEFYWNSLQVPRNMWFKNSSRVHMESDRLYRPNWFESDLLFKRADYPWRNNYAIHVWTNKNPVPKTLADIETANTTIAQIFRHVLYGDAKPRTRVVRR